MKHRFLAPVVFPIAVLLISHTPIQAQDNFSWKSVASLAANDQAEAGSTGDADPAQADSTTPTADFDGVAPLEGDGHGLWDSRCDACDPVDPRLLGMFVRSDTRFSKFISPMTNPVYFEDPRTLTEARLIYLRHKVPLAAGAGNLNVVALQVRAALTERLSIIATKDGFVTSTNALIDDGWADVNVGLKYNLFANAQTQTLLSGGVTFELPVGSTRTLQGTGDGLFHLYLTGGQEIAGGHWLSASGFLLPTNVTEESQIWYWSNHFDHELGSTGIYGLVEVNWYHWMRSGKGGIPGVEGGDLFNFGSTGVAGNDIVTGAFGIKFKPGERSEIGIAWELPLTAREDVLDNRLTVDWILRY